MPKDRMIEALGEGHLLLPGLVASGLAANDRVKYLLTLLQAARTSVDGAAEITGLRDERLASGVEDSRLDRVVGGTTRESDGRYRIPGSQALARRAIDEVQTMLAPLHAAGVPVAWDLDQRLQAVSAALSVDGDLVASDDIARLTAGPRHRGDSLHQVVMDAHRELNALDGAIATESIDGARAHDLSPADRELVRAFVRGVHSTERLKFDHPGLGTIATRTGPTLVIQNDLGTRHNPAHIVVIRVTGRVVTITYTDVHLARLLSFQALLAPWRMDWEDTRSRSDTKTEGGLFHLASGRFEAGDDAELERFIEQLGSRLVFIIDWNRARMRLRRLVGRRTAIELRRWAAEHEYGHMAFLRAGADGLVHDALEFAGGRVARAGESLQIATDQVHEGVISSQTALARLEELDLAAIRRVHVDAPEGTEVLARAIPASVGVANGPLALDRESVDRIARTGAPPVLVRAETATEDIAVVAVSAGVLTGSGGRTSHAAVVARELGKPCRVGCDELELDLTARTARIGGRLLSEGDVICVDAESGLVFAGAPAVIEERPTDALREVAAWRAAVAAGNGGGI